MYAPTSTNSPRSGPTSGDEDRFRVSEMQGSSGPLRGTNARSASAGPEDGLTDFDGAGEILRTWGAGLRPDPDLTVSQWVDKHRMLSGRASAEPGRYRTVRTPYMREIMDRLSPGDPAQRVVFMKAAQVGATEAGNNWIGFAIHQAPGPMFAVQPTVELAKRNSRQRIDPLIDESPDLRERVKPARSRDAGNTMLSKEFAGGILIMTGANSAVGLRSTPARYIFLDEVDAYPASADEEGDPVTLAEARSLTFAHRRKVFLVSTPTIRGLSRIEREYEASDQRRFFVPCPHCGAMQWLKFDRLRWQKGRPETAEYHCEGCDQPIGEHHKTAMLEAGEWRATAVAADPTTVGYHLSALYSPIGWLSWERIVRAWDAAQGSDEAIKAFRNTILGETWVETGEAPDWQRLYDRRERWTSGTVPAGGLFLTAGAGVQKDRIEVDVWAWGRGLESWLVDHVVIEGGPDRHDAWSELTALLDRSWLHERGAHLRIAWLAIDTGYEAPAVYAWSRAQGFAQVSPVKGVEGFNRSSPVSGPTFVDVTEGGKRLRRGARLWTVAVSTFKAETYRFLRLERPTEEERAEGAAFPPGTIHLPTWVESEWLKQVVAEQLVTVRTKRGFAKLEWQKLRERNEALDCRVYARAAAWIAGADRWPEARWQELTRQLAVDERPQAQDASNTPPRRPTALRRTVRSSYMG
jgi:phage terminase large subunit GpA-like protein